jgi:hypothetical protein
MRHCFPVLPSLLFCDPQEGVLMAGPTRISCHIGADILVCPTNTDSNSETRGDPIAKPQAACRMYWTVDVEFADDDMTGRGDAP